jgi:hypothetical protein
MDKISLLNKLRKVDEVSLLELLNITSDDLVDAFYEKVEERFEYIHDQLENTFPDE